MSKDATLSFRINSELKSQVEDVLDKLGIPMTTAITMYFNQIVMRNGIPFSPTIVEKPKTYFDYTENELAESVDLALAEYDEGKVHSLEEVYKSIK